MRFFKNDQVKTTSGRIEDWKAIINNLDYNNNLFFGYGAQGDRYLINQTASNGVAICFCIFRNYWAIIFFNFTFTLVYMLLNTYFQIKKKA